MVRVDVEIRSLLNLPAVNHEPSFLDHSLHPYRYRMVLKHLMECDNKARGGGDWNE